MYQELFLNSVVWYPPSQASNAGDFKIVAVVSISLLVTVSIDNGVEETNSFVDSFEENKSVDRCWKGVELVILLNIKLSFSAKEMSKFDGNQLDVVSKVSSTRTLFEELSSVVIFIISSPPSFVEVCIKVEMFCNISLSVFVQDLNSKKLGML